jgi:hypothetical protein
MQRTNPQGEDIVRQLITQGIEAIGPDHVSPLGSLETIESLSTDDGRFYPSGQTPPRIGAGILANTTTNVIVDNTPSDML